MDIVQGDRGVIVFIPIQRTGVVTFFKRGGRRKSGGVGGKRGMLQGRCGEEKKESYAPFVLWGAWKGTGLQGKGALRRGENGKC